MVSRCRAIPVLDKLVESASKLDPGRAEPRLVWYHGAQCEGDHAEVGGKSFSGAYAIRCCHCV